MTCSEPYWEASFGSQGYLRPFGVGWSTTRKMIPTEVAFELNVQKKENWVFLRFIQKPPRLVPAEAQSEAGLRGFQIDTGPSNSPTLALGIEGDERPGVRAGRGRKEGPWHPGDPQDPAPKTVAQDAVPRADLGPGGGRGQGYRPGPEEVGAAALRAIGGSSEGSWQDPRGAWSFRLAKDRAGIRDR